MVKPRVGVLAHNQGRFWVLFVLGVVGLWAVPVLGASFVVNSTNDVNDGTCDATHCSLREAINAANATNADDTITFSVSGTIVLSSQLPNIVSESTAGKLTIDGSGQSITISGNNSVRVMRVNSGANLTLKTLTISDGKATSDVGGGTVNITNSTFSQNSAPTGGGISTPFIGTLPVCPRPAAPRSISLQPPCPTARHAPSIWSSRGSRRKGE